MKAAPVLRASGMRIGITGGIACGKSALTGFLEEWGWGFIDTDQIARACLAPGEEGYKKTIDAFGKEILRSDLVIDRSRLGQVVFADFNKLRLLNSLLHPIIREEWQRAYSHHLRIRPEEPAAVVIPLLFETSVESEFDRVICVGCSGAVQRMRLKDRGLDGEAIRQRLAAQWPVARKMEQSDIVIWNNGSWRALELQAQRLNQSLCTVTPDGVGEQHGKQDE